MRAVFFAMLVLIAGFAAEAMASERQIIAQATCDNDATQVSILFTPNGSGLAVWWTDQSIKLFEHITLSKVKLYGEATSFYYQLSAGETKFVMTEDNWSQMLSKLAPNVFARISGQRNDCKDLPIFVREK